MFASTFLKRIFVAGTKINISDRQGMYVPTIQLQKKMMNISRYKETVLSPLKPVLMI